jgi:hypothetical protein
MRNKTYLSLKVSGLLLAVGIVLFSAPVSALEEEWTGIVNRRPGTVLASIEEGGPFQTKEACFEWARTRLLFKVDTYRCGTGCQKKADGDFQCVHFELDPNPPKEIPIPISRAVKEERRVYVG